MSIQNHEEWEERLESVTTLEEFKEHMTTLQTGDRVQGRAHPRVKHEIFVPPIVEGHLEAFIDMLPLERLREPKHGIPIQIQDDYATFYPEVYRTATNMEWLRMYTERYARFDDRSFCCFTGTGINFVLPGPLDEKQRIFMSFMHTFPNIYHTIYQIKREDDEESVSYRPSSPDYFQELQDDRERVIHEVMGHDGTRPIKSTILSYLYTHSREPLMRALTQQLIADELITRDDILRVYNTAALATPRTVPRLAGANTPLASLPKDLLRVTKSFTGHKHKQ